MRFSSLPDTHTHMVTLYSDRGISPVCTTQFLNLKEVTQRSVSSDLGYPRKQNELQSLSTFDLGFGYGFLSQRARSRIQPLCALNAAEYRRLKALEKTEEEDEDLCPVECVKEFKTRAELGVVLETAKESNALVVVDFYKTACGSCKYIEQGFIKLCKGAGDDEAAVIFLKHNVMDEYEEQSEVAEELKIKVVPLFHFYKDGQLLESFPTREKSKILETIQKYLSPISKESKDKT